MATSKLQLYNLALTQYLGERKIASLSENREPRRALDDVWDDGQAIQYCLEQGHWKFAQRAVMLAYNPSITPEFGHIYAYTKPSDCVRLSKMCSDEYFNEPLLDYVEEAGFWAADLAEIYVSYVSNDASFGNDMSLWPATFVHAVASYLAQGAVTRLKASASAKKDLEAEHYRKLVDARSKDAMEGPTQFVPTGNWARVRQGGTRRDGGSRSRLIG